MADLPEGHPAESDVPAHLTPEVELRLERMADAANEAEIRWLIGEWLTEIGSAIPSKGGKS